MTTQAPPMDQTKVEAKQAFKESSVALFKFFDKLYPVSVVISSFLGVLVVIFSALYFVVNLRVAPIEARITNIEVRITNIEAELKEMDKKQEARHNQIIRKQEERHNQLLQKQEERHNQILQYLLQQQKSNK